MIFDYKDIKNIYTVADTVYVSKNDGTSWVCGYDEANPLGLPDTVGKNYCKFFNSEEEKQNVKKIYCSEEQTYVLKNDGTLWMCGCDYGYLGLNETDTLVPVLTKLPIDDVKELVLLELMGPSIVVHKNDGSLWGAGLSLFGTISPNGFDPNNPNLFDGSMELLYGFSKFADNVKKFCYDLYGITILTNDNTLLYRGYNIYGTGGVGTTGICTEFTEVIGVNGAEVADMHSDLYFHTILKTDGTVMIAGADMNFWEPYNYDSNSPTSQPTYRAQESLINIKSLVKKNPDSFIGAGYFLTNNNEILAIGANLLFGSGGVAFGPNYIGQDVFGPVVIESNIDEIYDAVYLSFKKNNNIYILNIQNGQFELFKTTFNITDININSIVSMYSDFCFMLEDNENEKYYFFDYEAVTLQRYYNVYNSNKLYCINDRNFKQMPINNIKDIVTFNNYSHYDGTICIITEDGKLYGKSPNVYGQLGLGNTTAQTDFVLLPIDNVSKAAVGKHTIYALKNNGELYSAGLNDKGQLGIGNNTNVTTFTKVATTALGTKKVVDVKAGYYYAIILDEDGCPYGVGNQWGNGVGYSRNYFSKGQTLLSGVKKFGKAYNTLTFALKEDGTVWVTGSDTTWLEYFKGITSIKQYVQIPGLSDIVDVYIDDFNFALYCLDKHGDLYAMGTAVRCSEFDIEFDSNYTNQPTVTTIQKVAENVKDVMIDTYSVIILKNDGTVYGGGSNFLILKDTKHEEKAYYIFKPITNFKVKRIFQTVNYINSIGKTLFVLDVNDNLYVTGSNSYGQFGLHITDPNYMNFVLDKFIKLGLPKEFKNKKVNTILNNKKIIITDYAHSKDHELFISDNGVYVKGNNNEKQLGDFENVTEIDTFTKCSNDFGCKEIECNDSITVMLLEDGTISYLGKDANQILGPNSSNTLKDLKGNHIRNKKDIMIVETLNNEIYVAGEGNDFTKWK